MAQPVADLDDVSLKYVSLLHGLGLQLMVKSGPDLFVPNAPHAVIQGIEIQGLRRPEVLSINVMLMYVYFRITLAAWQVTIQPNFDNFLTK